MVAQNAFSVASKGPCLCLMAHFQTYAVFSYLFYANAMLMLWTVLRSEIPNGMCAKLRTVAASNNRDHARNLSLRTLVVTFKRSHVIGRATTSQSLYCLLTLHLSWCYSSRTSRLWWITQSMQHHRRGCNNSIMTKTMFSKRQKINVP